MKIHALLAAIGMIWLISLGFHEVTAHAQTPASVVQVDTMQGSISTCQVHTGVSTLCIGTDGMAFSKLGAAYTVIPLSESAPVAGGVTSINGKTGAVTIAATTTLQ